MAFCVILYTRITINLRVCAVIPLGCSGGGPTQQAIQWLQLVSLKEHHTTACLPANINALNIYYIIACLLTNGSAAFKWKLHSHWLKGQQQHITVVKKTPNLHHLRLLLMNLKPISCHPYRRNHNVITTWFCSIAVILATEYILLQHQVTIYCPYLSGKLCMIAQMPLKQPT